MSGTMALIPRSEGERGVALLMAIVAVLLLSVVVLDTRAGVNLFEDIAYNAAYELQTEYIARSGLALVQAALAKDDVKVDSFSDDWAAANSAGTIPIADIGWVSGRVEDEEGKLDINALVNNDGETDEETAKAAGRLWSLLTSLGISNKRADEIVDSLTDWMDEDNIALENGAEERYYSDLPGPYSCPNERLRTVGELALVKGVGGALLNRGEGDIPPLRKFVTIYGRRDGKININTASAEVLMSLTPKGVGGVDYIIDRDLAEEIISVRSDAPFQTTNELKERVADFHEDLYNQVLSLIDVNSSHFSAVITGETERSSSTAAGVFARQGEHVSLVYYRGF